MDRSEDRVINTQTAYSALCEDIAADIKKIEYRDAHITTKLCSTFTSTYAQGFLKTVQVGTYFKNIWVTGRQKSDGRCYYTYKLSCTVKGKEVLVAGVFEDLRDHIHNYGQLKVALVSACKEFLNKVKSALQK